MRWKYILLDADETLFNFNASQRNAFFATLEDFGIEPREEYIEKYHVINDSWWKRLERGEATREQVSLGRFSDFAAAAGVEISDLTAFDLAYKQHLGDFGVLLDGAYEFIEALYGKCELYIITNGMARTQHRRFDASPIRSMINALFISEELDANKPSKEYFERVLAAIRRDFPDMRESECVVVGDSLTSDILGARNAGLYSCLYDRHGKYDEKTAAVRPDCVAHSYDEIIDIISR